MYVLFWCFMLFVLVGWFVGVVSEFFFGIFISTVCARLCYFYFYFYFFFLWFDHFFVAPL